MTRDEILAMKPGRELDALVAEKVFGWTYWRSKHGHWIIDTPDGRHFEPLFGKVRNYDPETSERLPDPNWWDGLSDELPYYSTDIAAAWEVVARLRDLWTEATRDMDGVTNRVMRSDGSWVDFTPPFDDMEFFEYLHRHADRRWPWAFFYVTPEAICKAALLAVMGGEAG
jgi:hypothetical protein